MSMSDTQWEFLKDIAKLITFAEENGFKMTEGEGHRTLDQQLLYFHGLQLVENNGDIFLQKAKRRTKTKHSMHLKQLAHDFNVFVDGKLTYDPDKIRPLGEYWKSLSEENVWGGDWGWDAGHFQRGSL